MKIQNQTLTLLVTLFLTISVSQHYDKSTTNVLLCYWGALNYPQVGLFSTVLG